MLSKARTPKGMHNVMNERETSNFTYENSHI